MKIVEKGNNLVKFEKINIGEVIRINGEYYLRIIYHASNEPVNVVNLKDGSLKCIDSTTVVEKVNCELVIK